MLVKAFRHNLPAVASRLGAMAEIAEEGETGLHFERRAIHKNLPKKPSGCMPPPKNVEKWAKILESIR